MKIFVCEYISCGGLYREPLPASLAREGLLMRDALLHDLAELDDVEVLTTVDPRVPLPLYGQTVMVRPEDDLWQVWRKCMAQSDAVWLIAPETGGVLLQLTEAAAAQGRAVLGCSAEAVRLTSSKSATHRVMQSADIPVVPTYGAAEWPLEAVQHGWVAKPDDGVGCCDTAFFSSAVSLQQWLHGREATYVVQPFMQGQPASLSILCKDGRAWLLSCNLQQVTLEESFFQYSGSVVNGAAQHWSRCAALATQIAQAIPGLAGYVGVDTMLDQELIHVLEINPRLTTSYTGLHRAMGLNPARLIVDLFYNDGFRFPETFSRNRVEIELNNGS